MNSTPIAWALDTLQQLGYSVTNREPELIIQAPWSTVYRFDTESGYFFLKLVPAGLSAEPKVIAFLREKCNASVPTIIADSPELHCFLMKDAGIPLRQFLKKTFDTTVLIKAIQDYIALQKKSIPHVNTLMNLGVPNWGIEKIPECYEKLIQQKSMLLAGGLTPIEVEKLPQFIPRLNCICDEIAKYSIPNTFSQNDFHDNNMLIHPDTKKMTFIDLGEVTVTHPFFSLLNMLKQLKEKHEIDQHSHELIKQSMLQPWLSYATEMELLKVLSFIQQCWPVYSAIGAEYCVRNVQLKSADAILKKGIFAESLRPWARM